jgi:hypothetical protein
LLAWKKLRWPILASNYSHINGDCSNRLTAGQST